MAEFSVARGIGPFASRVAALPVGGDVRLADRPSLAIATVMARNGSAAKLAERFLATTGVALPSGPAAVTGADLTVVATGPGTWLVVRDAAAPGWFDGLADALAGVASLADQSSAYALLRLSGTGARRLLGRGAFIDFQSDNFAAGSAAVTLIAHIGVIVWQRDDAPTYELAVFRSFAGSLWHWLETAAAGFGATLGQDG